MVSRFDEIAKNIFAPSQQIPLIQGDNVFPLNIKVGSIEKVSKPNENEHNSPQLNPASVNISDAEAEAKAESEAEAEAEAVVDQKSEEKVTETKEVIPQRKQYSIETDSSCLIKLPSEYSTDILYEKQAIDFINGKNTETWDKKCDNEKITIYQIFVWHI